MHRLLVFAAAIALSCATDQSLPVESCRLQPFDELRFPVPSYWRPGAFGPESLHPQFLWDDWFSAELCAMEEPPIENISGNSVYRLLYLRSFHSPIAVTLTQASSSRRLRATLMSPPQDEPGIATVLDHRNRVLTTDEWAKFEQLLVKSKFWTMQSWPPPRFTPEGHRIVTFDGSEWMFEARTPRASHTVATKFPGLDPGNDDFKAMLLYLLSLSGLQIEEVY